MHDKSFVTYASVQEAAGKRYKALHNLICLQPEHLQWQYFPVERASIITFPIISEYICMFKDINEYFSDNCSQHQLKNVKSFNDT